MNWEVLDELIERGQLPGTNFRLMRQGTRVPREWFTRDGEIDARALKALLRQPVTLVLLDIANLWRPMRRLVRRLQQQLGHPIICGTIATISQGGAFQPHYDLNDLLLLQISGRKRWRVFAEREVVPNVRNSQAPPPETEPAMSFTMEPGDLLYLPRGVWHDAAADEDSLHVGLHLDSPTGVKFGQSLLRMLEDDPVFAEDIPVYLGPDAMASYERRLKERFVQLIAEADLTRYATGLTNDSKLAPVPGLAHSPAPAELATAVELVSPLVPTLGIDLVEASVFGANLDVTPAVRAVVEVLRQEPLISVTALEERVSGTCGSLAVRDALAALDRHGIVNLLNDWRGRS
ncbi:MAG: cupin domain-containing protein [Vicinamibacterales bacterium]